MSKPCSRMFWGFNRKEPMERPDASGELKKYESVIILHPDCSEDEQKAIMKKNVATITSFDGKMNHMDTWGRRKLANPIGKSTMGVYFHSTFEAKGSVIAELERTLRINDRVLRFMHTKIDDRESLPKFVERFKNALQETANREKEREAKIQQRKTTGNFQGRSEGRSGR